MDGLSFGSAAFAGGSMVRICYHGPLYINGGSLKINPVVLHHDSASAL